MRRFHATSRGLSLVELIISTAVASIALLIGMTSFVLGWRGVRDVQYANRAYLDTFGVMNSIQEQVERAKTIQMLTGCSASSYGSAVASPGSTAYQGILLSVPNPKSETDASVSTDPLLRAYWLSGNNLMMQWISEGVGPVTVYSDVTSFSAAIQNSPTNSLVQLSCTCADGTETISMTTVAWKRN